MRTKLILLSVLLSSCSYVSVPLLSPYQMDVRQGNFVTPEMRDKLKLGMTRQQVHYVLGTPLVFDAFHADRWDYVYRLKQHGEVVDNQRLTLYFEGDKLVRIDDSRMPAYTPAPVAAEPAAAEPAAAAAVAPAAAASLAAEPVPAPAPEAPKPQPVVKADPAKEVVMSVQVWANAWSSRDVNTYLAAYKPDYKPEGMTRQAWEKQRKERIGKSQKIELGLGNLSIRMHDETHATVKFIQNYRSASYRDNLRKTLQLEKVGDKWLIASELTEKE